MCVCVCEYVCICVYICICAYMYVWHLRQIRGRRDRWVQRSVQEGRGVPGRFSGGFENSNLLCVIGEFVDGLMSYSCFQFGVVLCTGQWLLDDVTFYRFSKLLLLRTREVICLQTLVFQLFQSCTFRFEWQIDAETMTSGGGFWGPVGSILW